MAAACERTMAPCRVVRSFSPTGVSARAPNPVFTPYTGASPARASTPTERLPSIRRGTSGPRLARACPCATATTSSTVNPLPSTTTSRMTDSFPRPAAAGGSTRRQPYEWCFSVGPRPLKVRFHRVRAVFVLLRVLFEVSSEAIVTGAQDDGAPRAGARLCGGGPGVAATAGCGRGPDARPGAGCGRGPGARPGAGGGRGPGGGPGGGGGRGRGQGVAGPGGEAGGRVWPGPGGEAGGRVWPGPGREAGGRVWPGPEAR